jgi:Zn-dependent protease
MQTWFPLLRLKHLVVRFHFTWILLAPLALWTFAYLVLPTRLPDGASTWLAAIAIVVVYVASLAIHEGAHLIAARLLGVPMPAVNLHPIGALTRRVREAAGPVRTLIIAAAGPVANLIVLWLLGLVVSDVARSTADVILAYAAWANLLLALVNLLPCLPLDGGRMLRAFLWWMHDNLPAASRIATNLNYVVTGVLLFIGLGWLVSPTNMLHGLWMLVLAWMIYEAGTSLTRRGKFGTLLRRLTARDVMTDVEEKVEPGLVLRDLVARWRGRSGENATPVVADGRLMGLVNRSLVSGIMQGYWDERTAGDAMLPAARLPLITPSTSLAQVLPLLDADALDPQPLLVVDEGRLIGLIEQHEVLPLLEVQEALGLDHQFGQVEAPKLLDLRLPSRQAASRAD